MQKKKPWTTKNIISFEYSNNPILVIFYTDRSVSHKTNLLYGELAVTELFLSTTEFVLDLNLRDLQLLGSRYQCFDVTLDLGDVDPGHCVIFLQLVRGSPAEL